MSDASASRDDATTPQTAPPHFSVLTPVHDPPVDVLRETIASVRAQTFDDWEWIVVDDASTRPGVLATLREAAGQDPRIRVIERAESGHICRATNDALAAARGEFVAFLDHDDLLAAGALETVARYLAPYDDVDYLYSDEDKVDDAGRNYDEFLKPDWSPERLLGQMYPAHLSVARTSLVRSLGGLRVGFEGSQDHDLVLRVTEQARRIVHIPDVLYHWRNIPGSAASVAGAKPYAQQAGLRAVNEAISRRGIAGRATEIDGHPGQYRVVRELPPERRVSLVIPTMGVTGTVWAQPRVFVIDAVRSALQHTNHDNLEVVVVYDAPTPPAVLTELEELCGDKLVLVPYPKPFNFSEKINVGFLASTGDRVVLLNDDVQVTSPQWIEQLVAPLEEPDVGMTGAKLYFSDGLIQHAGHMYSEGGYHHPYHQWPRDSSGTMSDLLLNREVSGVTAACAAMRRDVFDPIGGLSELLPANFNDVDLCYKVRSRGFRILVVAGVELYHFESRSRVRGIEGWEHQFVLDRWGYPYWDPFMRLPVPP